jgi:hypothetical protein
VADNKTILFYAKALKHNCITITNALPKQLYPLAFSGTCMVFVHIPFGMPKQALRVAQVVGIGRSLGANVPELEIHTSGLPGFVKAVA